MATINPLFLGSDTSCITDLSRIDKVITNPVEVIGQRVLRRWQTQRGALASINDDPDFGWDITQYVNAKLSPAGKSQAETQLESEAKKDEQVETCHVSLTHSINGTLTVKASFTTTAGPFQLTLDVRDLTIESVFSFGEQ